MPKAARRTSGATSAPRAEPYPAIKPGDKPSGSKAVSTKRSSETTIEATVKPATDKAPKKALAEKRASEVNATVPISSSFLDVKLDGEDTNSVCIYDTASTIRQKINALLGKDNKDEKNLNPQDVTKDGKRKPFNKSSFVKAIGEGSTRSLDTFLKTKRMKQMGGCSSPIYAAAYVFFEKQRIFEGKKKTAARLKVEADKPYGFDPTKDPEHQRFWCGPNTDPSDFMDQYGQW